MPVAVERIILNPQYASNCYLIRAGDDAREAVVVDPGGDPGAAPPGARAPRRRPAGDPRHPHRRRPHRRRRRARCRGTGAEVWAPAGELEALRSGETRGGYAAWLPHEPEHPVADGRPGRRPPASTFEVVARPGPLGRSCRVRRRRARLLRRPPVRRLRRARRSRRAATGRRCSTRSRVSLDRYGPDAVVYPGHGEPTTLGRELERTRSSASCAQRRASERRVPGAARDARRPARRPAALVDTSSGRWRSSTGAYGYRPIQTPASRTPASSSAPSGAGSDIVQKEMYTFTDRSDRSLTLRPEGTAPIARAYLEHGMHREPQPVKLYTIAPMYRYAAPQKGRYREHWQLSVEAIGSADPAVDAEVIQLYAELAAAASGSREWELQLNSIGDAACRPAYVERLNAWLDEHADVLDDDARHKRATSPLRVFDVKNPRRARRRSRTRRRSASRSATPAATHFAAVRRRLDALRRRLHARRRRSSAGLDYYTRTTFEFVGPEEKRPVDDLPAAAATTGSSRQIGGPPTPGHRLRRRARAAAARARARGRDGEPPAASTSSSSSTAAPREQVLDADGRAASARASPADTDYAGRSLKGQMTQAGRTGARTVVIAGADGCRGPAPSGGRGAGGSARRPRRYAQRSDALARPARQLAAPRGRGPRRSRSPAGSRTRRDHGGLVFVDLRDEERPRPGRDQPRERARGGRDRRTSCATSSSSGRAGAVVRRAPETVNPAMATGEIEVQAEELEILSRSTPLPFQLDEEGVDETLRIRYRWLDLRREKMQRNIRTRAQLVSIIRAEMEARRLRRHRDADHGQADARGRARLPRADAPAAGPLLRAAAEPADLQAAARDLRLRALLPDRALLPRRGSARRPAPGADPARRRDGLPRPGVPVRADRADRRPDLARAAAASSSRRRSRG